jgi:lysophospholipase L1-like esterase
MSNPQRQQQQHGTTIHNSVQQQQQQHEYSQIAATSEGVVGEDDDDDIIIIEENSSSNDSITNENNNLTADASPPHIRPFNYIGDLDPKLPQPWPEEEVDWWALHRKLVEDVRSSDASPIVLPDDEEGGDADNNTATHQQQQPQYLPQLIFYGDSITEGWAGTSFGKLPSKHRMWNANNNEDEQIRQLFTTTFGIKSSWGRRAWKQPLILGISGSRTYDLLWRIENGEFPTSQLAGDDEGDVKSDALSNNDQKGVKSPKDASLSDDSSPLEKLERIYIVLIGTNNLGGGMLPSPTIEGMDAVGRTLLQLHTDTFSSSSGTTPAAIVFSELLPRRDNFRAMNMCPPRCKNSTTLEPYESFMPAINEVNRALPQIVQGWRDDFPNSRIVLLSSSTEEEEGSETDADVDGQEDKPDDALKDSISLNHYQHTLNCGREMFAFDEGNDEFDRYMPDRLHPNAKGYELWSRCIKRGLEAIMMDSSSMQHLEHQ